MRVVINTIHKWRYFPHLDNWKKFNLFQKALCWLSGMWVYEYILVEKGYRQVRFFEVLDTKTGKTELIKEK